VFSARLLYSFIGRVLANIAYILVFLDVFIIRFFPNVFIALESAFLLVDTLFKGSYNS
jgi:hypothetical protein